MTGQAGSWRDADLERRVGKVEARVDHHDEEIGQLQTAVAGLLSWQTDMRARHASGPAWVGLAVSGLIGVASMIITLLLAGGLS